MASYRGHLAFSSVLGVAYGGYAMFSYDMDWGPAVLGAVVTTLGGLAPDLDSDSGVPVRELFSLAATFVPLLLIRRLVAAGFTVEQTLVVMAGVYVLIRYGISEAFRRMTVHRGMFHSVPAMLILGLLVHLTYHTPNVVHRLFLSGGAMLGFLSHLVLDEIYSVDFMGVGIRFNKYAGSALKFASPSTTATLGAYALLAGLLYIEGQGTYFAPIDWPAIRARAVAMLPQRPEPAAPGDVRAGADRIGRPVPPR